MSKNLGNNLTWNFVDKAPTQRFVDSGNKKLYFMLVNETGNKVSEVVFGDATEQGKFLFCD